MTTQPWVVHKFGGTSVGSSSSIRKCIEIIRPLVRENQVAVVVSAMGGKPKVTDLLLQSVRHAADNDMDAANEKIQCIRMKHIDCLHELFGEMVGSEEVITGLMKVIDKDLADISDLLRAVALMRFPHDQILELVSGYGEIWSATLISHAMRRGGMEFVFLNARDVLFVSEEGELGGQKIEWEMSESKLAEYIERATKNNGGKMPNLLITGYIASMVDGVATTLKRDGSDYSASIFAKMLKATSVTIWTDVSGVYSADPRRVPEALIIPDVSYSEAIELAYFGAKVIHPKTMAPAIIAKIPIYIRNTFKPQDQGTKIANPVELGPEDIALRKTNCVCGFSSIDDISLVNMEGNGMIGVPGIAHRLFGALKAAAVSVMFIAQASSEHSICFAIKSSAEEVAKKAIEEAFFYELNASTVTNLTIIKNCSIIAAVGESMTHMPGVSGVFFGAIGNAGVNVLSISQGCDERNISTVVHARDATRALRAVHAAFCLSALGLSIGIIGTGRVGSALIQSLLEQTAIMEKRYQIKIGIRGVINSRNMILGEDLSGALSEKLRRVRDSSSFPSRAFSLDGLSSEVCSANETEAIGKKSGLMTPSSRSNSEEMFSVFDVGVVDAGDVVPLAGESTRPKAMARSHSNNSLHDLEKAMNEDHSENRSADLEAFFQHITSAPTPHCIIIDATSSDDVALLHPKWLTGGAHIVTANKRAICNDLSTYNSVYKAARLNSRMYMSEVTIGASIPVKTTLNDLLSSGDAIKSILGVMSVSANDVMSNMCELGMTFSESVQKTYAKNLFETNQFDDLSGLESAQKLLILARELGIPLMLDDIDVEAIADPRFIADWGCVDTSGVFEKEDAYYEKKVAEAKSKGCTLRYVQRLELDPPAELGEHFDIERCYCKARTVLEEVPIGAPHAIQGPVFHFSFYTARYMNNPLVISGPLSDSINTASGMVGDILRIAKSIGAKNTGPEELGRSRSNSAS